MKNNVNFNKILAENMLRFGAKNLSELDQKHLSMLNEAAIDKRAWANKQTAAKKNLSTQYAAQKYPITPVIIGPYCLAQVSNVGGQSVQNIKDGGNYMGDIIGWTARMGLPSLQTLGNNEVGYFTFNLADGFGIFEVTTDKLDNSVAALNESYSRLSVPMIQEMWKNITQATEMAKMMPALKTNVLAYQTNPADATKGYDKITGRAAEFLKSIKFA